MGGLNQSLEDDHAHIVLWFFLPQLCFDQSWQSTIHPEKQQQDSDWQQSRRMVAFFYPGHPGWELTHKKSGIMEIVDMPNNYHRMTKIINFLRNNTTLQPTLETVAAQLSLSPGYLQRLFRHYTGISPKRYLQYLTSARARLLLDQSAPILEATFASGLSGPSRLHDLLVATEAVTPGEYQSKGERLQLRYGIHPTPFGPALIGLTARGICRLDFFDDGGVKTLEQLRRDWPNAELVEDESATAKVINTAFTSLLNKPEKPLMLHLRGTNFQLKVWQALLHIPPGCLAGYGRIAEQIGQPTAARAVGHAIGQNPICYIIPCHRVLRSDGSIGGYRSGTLRKEVILMTETLHLGADDLE